MKAIILRNIPPEVQKGIRKRARRKGISASRAAIEMLQEQLPKRGEDGLYHDLDDLFGSWSPEQAEEFDRILKEMKEEEKRFIGK
jgi:hypothetical protein